jgi:hypothetical protein
MSKTEPTARRRNHSNKPMTDGDTRAKRTLTARCAGVFDAEVPGWMKSGLHSVRAACRALVVL